MKLIAQKPCSFDGKKFYIGDEIPAECVANPKAQEKMGVLAISGGEGAATVSVDPVITEIEAMEVVIHAEEGDMPLNLTAGGLQSIVDVLTSSVSDAEPIVKEMTDGDALILLHVVDSRKAVKAAAEERAKALSSEGSEDAEASGEGEGEL